MPKSREFQIMLDACQQEGCLLCRLTQESTVHYLDAWKYELFTDMDIRKELRRTQGFCHKHTWQLAHMGAILQLAQSYRDIITDITEQLQSNAPPSNGLFRRFFENSNQQGHTQQAQCPACLQKARAEINYINTLRKILLDPDFYAQFVASSGLCLDHFRLTCELKMSDTPGDWLTPLRKAQLACLQRLDAQLSELIRKHDYHFKDEPRGDEMLAWKKAAAIVAGEENS